MGLAAGAIQPEDVAGRVNLLLARYRRPVLRQNCNHIENIYARSLILLAAIRAPLYSLSRFVSWLF